MRSVEIYSPQHQGIIRAFNYFASNSKDILPSNRKDVARYFYDLVRSVGGDNDLENGPLILDLKERCLLVGISRGPEYKATDRLGRECC